MPARLADGARLALTTFTVLPLRPGRVDRAAAGTAMLLAPVVGALLGAGLGAIGTGVLALGGTQPLAGAVAVAAGVLATRALHLDGLADSVDGLGAYRDRAAALEIMKRPDIGPFGVVAIVLVLLVQALATGAVLGRGTAPGVAGVATAALTGRLAVTWACRRRVPAARADGLGALVAGTVSGPGLAVATLAGLLLSLAARPERHWQGALAVGVGLAVGYLLTRHAVRRLGGVTGDVLGAVLEVATSTALLVLALG